MANIGATTAFYKVETSLTRANNEVSKSMERLATGKQNANAGDRSSYVAMADTFRMDYVGTKAGIKGASVVMGYLETGMRVLDSASSLLSRLQELAVLGANDTNTVQDHEAINLEAEALADEFHRLMTTSTYKGKDVFVANAASEYVGLGGRGAEMTFGIGRIGFTELYDASNERTISYTGGPNKDGNFHLTVLPSDAVLWEPQQISAVEVGVTYEITGMGTIDNPTSLSTSVAALEIKNASTLNARTDVVVGATFTGSGSSDLDLNSSKYFEGRILSSAANTTFKNLVKGVTYEVDSGTLLSASTAQKQVIVNNSTLTSTDELVAGARFTVKTTMDEGANANIGLNGLTLVGQVVSPTEVLTDKIETIQARINTARVQAGSQYAALESAVAYTTDLTAQYELGYNTVNDVNFSMETAHLAKNQILQQAATAMLAQANSGQQSLLQLIQG